MLYYWCKKYKSQVLNFVLLFYVFASVCGILTHYFVDPNAYWTLVSIPYQCICLFLFISPIIVYGKNEKKRSFKLMDDKRFKTLSYILIGLQSFTIIYFAAFDFSLLARGDLSQIRSEMLSGDLDIGASLSRTIAGVSSYYYCFNILFFFYSLAFRKDSKLFLGLLIGTSVSRIFHSLTYMGRDGILFWILSCLFNYFLFRPYLNKDSKKTIRVSFILLGSFAILLIGAISISRFGESDSGTFLSLVSYFGQPLNNFGQLFDKVHEYIGTKSMFPLLYGEKGVSGSEAMANADVFYLKYGFYSNIFFSFVGNMCRAWGPLVTFIIAIFFSVYYSARIDRKVTSIPTIIVLMFVSQIVLHNYFYWAYYIRVGNLFLFTLPFFVIYCNKSNGKIIHNNQENANKS